MPEKVIIYGKAGCPYTEKARSVYGSRAVYFDVEKDPKRLGEMLKHSGGRREVPVIVEGDKTVVGYGGS
jgi:glutaredoxin 3